MAKMSFYVPSFDHPGAFDYVESPIDRGDLKMYLDQRQVSEVVRTIDKWELGFGAAGGYPFVVTVTDNEGMGDILQMYRDVQPILDAAMKG